MPYLKPKEKPFEAMTRLLRGYASAEQIGIAIGRSAVTARSRMREPGELTLNELAAISRRLHIPKEEIMGAVKF